MVLPTVESDTKLFLNQGSKFPPDQTFDLTPSYSSTIFFLFEDYRRKQYHVYYDSITLPFYLRLIPICLHSYPAHLNHSLSYEPTDPSYYDQLWPIPDVHTQYIRSTEDQS